METNGVQSINVATPGSTHISVGQGGGFDLASSLEAKIEVKVTKQKGKTWKVLVQKEPKLGTESQERELYI